MKLLIVDDQRSVHLYLDKVLAQADLGPPQILHAYGGQEALSLLRAEPVDLMLLDIEMPGMDGLSLLRALPTLPQPAPWVVILTAYGEFAYARAALQGGVKDYLLKPIAQDELLPKLRSLAAAREAEQLRALSQLFERCCARIAQRGAIPEGMAPEIACPAYVVCRTAPAAAPSLDALPVAFRSDVPQGAHLLSLLIPEEGAMDALLAGLQAMDGPPGVSAPQAALSMLAQATHEALTAPDAPADDAHILARIRQHIDAHYGEDLSLERMAAQFFISRFQISRLFKRQYGVNYQEYVMRVRMEAAASMLRGSRLRLYEVSEQVGFEQASHFSSAFKRHFGQSPREYRQAHGQKGPSGPAPGWE